MEKHTIIYNIKTVHKKRKTNIKTDKSSNSFEKSALQRFHWLQWEALNSPSKTAPSLRRSPPPSNTPFPRPTPLRTSNGIWIRSAILPQYTFRTDRHTDGLGDMSASLAMLIYSDALTITKSLYNAYNLTAKNRKRFVLYFPVLHFQLPRMQTVMRQSSSLSGGGCAVRAGVAADD